MLKSAFPRKFINTCIEFLIKISFHIVDKKISNSSEFSSTSWTWPKKILSSFLLFSAHYSNIG
jgi:hypothetical protein